MPRRKRIRIRSHLRRPRVIRAGIATLVLFCVAVLIWGIRNQRETARQAAALLPPSRQLIAETLAPYLDAGEFPDEIWIGKKNHEKRVGVRYTLDWELQDHMDKILRSYRSDYSAFVALDGNTGRVLTLSTYSRKPNQLGNLALKSYFPAASVFKIVTAAAALDRKKVTPDTVIPFNGGFHTLYRRNVTQTNQNRWTRHITLREAFAKSINTVFAKLGLFVLDYSSLKEYAERFQFNHPIDSELPVQPSTFSVNDANDWALAEAASGFNRVATLSPLHGAMMAAAVANNGILMAPFGVESLSSELDSALYVSDPRVAAVAMSPEAAAELRGMMRETVARGTSRGAFRGFFKRKNFTQMEVGGKTGSLAGTFPKGKCDWFVGYAIENERIISFAALTVNEDVWRVKSSQLARLFLEKYVKMSATRSIAKP